METGIHRDGASHRRVEHWLLAAAVLIALMAVVFWRRISQAGDTSFSNDPRFVITAPPTISFPTTHASLTQRIFNGWFKLNRGIRKPSPATYTFPASPTNRCLIHGLLNQCMEVTGVRYVIPRDVAAGTVQFGHTNALTGPQWVQAFTEALQHGQPEFWDSQTKKFHRENLVLLTNSPRTVLVLPKAMVSEFQKPRASGSKN